MRSTPNRALSISILSVLALSLLGFPGVSACAPPSCVSAGGTGLTAKIVAVPNQVITGTVSASSCDIGIYIGPGVNNVTVTGATVTGANDHGIFVQDASNTVIKGSTISGNGVHPTEGVVEDKAVQLTGTTDALVKGNTVEFNVADGGIAITDDGPSLDPGAPVATAEAPIAGTGNLVTDNLVKDNVFGCGIVVAAYNAGAGVSNNVILKNTVLGGWSGTPFFSIPYTGGIVVAADVPNSTATNNIVVNNVVNGSIIPGIIVHSNAPGDYVSGNNLIRNTLLNNGFLCFSGCATEPDASEPTGINIVSEVPSATLANTQVLSNTITDDVNGVWLCNSVGTHIAHLQASTVTNPVAACASGGS